MEMAKHHTSMKDTQNITVNGFQKGFSSVFESLTEFSKSAKKMYDEVVTFSENATRVDDTSSKPPGSIHVEADDS